MEASLEPIMTFAFQLSCILKWQSKQFITTANLGVAIGENVENHVWEL